MTVRVLSRQEARRIAVQAQMLDGARPRDLPSLTERLTFLQLDPTSVVAPSADLVAWSRIGNDYLREHLTHALERDRTMFEHSAQDAPHLPRIAMAIPMTSLPLHLADMEALRNKPGRVRSWLDANAGFRRRVLDHLAESGPITSRDIPDTAEVPWASSGWTNSRNVTQMLTFLAERGHVAIAGRRGKQRVWDLAERVYPAGVEAPPLDEAQRARDELRLRALGIARPKMAGEAGVTVEVEGTDGVWRLDADATADGFEGRTALLSPFDRLIHDRDRTQELFDFEYILEMYKPEAKRRWGYFALPVLHHERLIGKVDATADRDVAQLVVHAVHQDVPFTRVMRASVDAELAALATWLGLDGVRFD